MSIDNQDEYARGACSLVWVEDTPEWSAAGNHLRGTLIRLRSAGVEPRRVIANASRSPSSRQSTPRKIFRILSVVLRAIVGAHRGTIITRWHPFSVLYLWVWRLRGAQIVLLVQGNTADMHAANPWTTKLAFLERMGLLAINMADVVITPSDGLADWVRRKAGRTDSDTFVIPNGVCLADFSPPAQTAGEPSDDTKYGVFVGNLASWQGIETLLCAFESDLWPKDLALYIIGDGVMKTVVEDRVGKGLRYLGPLARPEVARYLRNAVVSFATRKMVDSSSNGVSPFKIVEASAAGTPTIGTDVPGQAEMMCDLQCGPIVPPDDWHALANAARSIVESEALRAEYSRLALENVQRYDWAARSPELKAAIATGSRAATAST